MAAAGPTTYQEFFGVAANDPHAGDPTQIIQAQAPGAQVQPADLRAIVGTDPNPDPYLFVSANGRVHIVLRIHLVPPSFGQNQSRYAGQLVGQLDDVTELGNTLVSFPNNAFHLVSQGAQLNIFNLAELEAGLAGMGDDNLFDPPNAGDPHVEQVQVRFFTYVSYRYASLIIGLDGCTPAVAYRTIVGAVRNNNALANQEPLVNFLRASVTNKLGAKVRARTAEAYLRSVAQTFTSLGKPDPRLNSHGAIDFCIQRQLRGYKKVDPPPRRLKPLPIDLFILAADAARAIPTHKCQALAYMIYIAFFFLMRPGEHCDSGPDSHPFLWQDVGCN